MPTSAEVLEFLPNRVVTADPTNTYAGLLPSPDVVSQRIGDEIVLIHLRTNRIYEMNRTSARVWELQVDRHDVESIRAAMCAEFDVGEADLTREMDAFFRLLVEEKLASR